MAALGPMVIAPPAPVAEEAVMVPTETGNVVAGGLVPAGMASVSEIVTAPPAVANVPVGRVSMLPSWTPKVFPVLRPPVVVTPLAVIVSGRPLVTSVSVVVCITNEPCPPSPAVRVIGVTAVVGAGKFSFPAVATPVGLVTLKAWSVSMRKSCCACKVSAVSVALCSIAKAEIVSVPAAGASPGATVCTGIRLPPVLLISMFRGSRSNDPALPLAEPPASTVPL